MIIKVPATSANIGPGFDCLGIAFNIYNTFHIEEIEEGIKILGCDEKYANEDNLVLIAMKNFFHYVNYKAKGIYMKIHSEIPIARGLGSSAACILAGVMAANEISKSGFTKEEILEVATLIENHPDNLAPALYGGMTVAIKEGTKVITDKVNLSKELQFHAIIPSFTLSTKKSRSILPKSVSLEDATFNIGRVVMLIQGLTSGDLDKIQIGCMDRIHQDYRGELIEDYWNIINRCQELGAQGTFLSGAGPTIITITHKANRKFKGDLKQNLESKWHIKELLIEENGAVIEV